MFCRSSTLLAFDQNSSLLFLAFEDDPRLLLTSQCDDSSAATAFDFCFFFFFRFVDDDTALFVVDDGGAVHGSSLGFGCCCSAAALFSSCGFGLAVVAEVGYRNETLRSREPEVGILPDECIDFVICIKIQMKKRSITRVIRAVGQTRS